MAVDNNKSKQMFALTFYQNGKRNLLTPLKKFKKLFAFKFIKFGKILTYNFLYQSPEEKKNPTHTKM